jgi:hexosaminidase
VPEIDLPGHTQAAVAAYPELGNDPANPPEVWTEFGVSPRVLNTADETVEFMRNVLTELVDVFPSEFIHLGGDEVPPTEWAASPAARERMAEQGITDPQDLLGWWIGELAEHLKGLGRRVVLWDELVEHGAPAGSTIMAWRDRDRVLAALRAGHDVIATPHTEVYLNYPQAAGPGEPLSIADGDDMNIDVTSLGRVYAYDPEPGEAAPEVASSGARVVGLQGNLWAEYAPSPERAEYDLMPRLAAVAEVAWGTAGERDDADLRARLVTHLARLDAAGIGYRPLDELT